MSTGVGPRLVSSTYSLDPDRALYMNSVMRTSGGGGGQGSKVPRLLRVGLPVAPPAEATEASRSPTVERVHVVGSSAPRPAAETQAELFWVRGPPRVWS